MPTITVAEYRAKSPRERFIYRTIRHPASLMLIGGARWEKACRSGHTISDYFYDRFDKVAEDESAYIVNNVGDVTRARTALGVVSLLPGSQRLEDLQGELLLKHSKKDLDADAVAVQVRGRMKRLMRHFGMDFDLVVLDCPPGLSFAALAALDLANHVLVPFRPDFVSQFALDRVAMLIEGVETAEQLATIPFERRRYSCLPNCWRVVAGGMLGLGMNSSTRIMRRPVVSFFNSAATSLARMSRRFARRCF